MAEIHDCLDNRRNSLQNCRDSYASMNCSPRSLTSVTPPLNTPEKVIAIALFKLFRGCSRVCSFLCFNTTLDLLDFLHRSLDCVACRTYNRIMQMPRVFYLLIDICTHLAHLLVLIYSEYYKKHLRTIVFIVAFICQLVNIKRIEFYSIFM